MQLLEVSGEVWHIYIYIYVIKQLKVKVRVVATPLRVHNDVFLLNFLTIVTLARPKYELPDDGHRPKYVETF